MSKKGGKVQKEAATYEVRDVVLGKVRGYAPWPGMVVDPNHVPAAVSEDRPTSKKTTFYCVRFFPTGDYAWLVEKDISKLQPHEIESYIGEPHKKSADLLEGYRIALDPTKWIAERDAIASEAAEAEENAEVDQLHSDAEVEATSVSKSKKRKRESDAASTKAKKAPKVKKEAAESSKKKSASVGKSKKNGTKSKTMVESEDEGDQAGAGAAAEDVEGRKNASPPPAKKAKRDKEEEGEEAKQDDPEALKVRDWRHKLQKTFLSAKAIPKDEDMPSLDELFKTVESYNSMTIEQLQFSKIGKVMRHIAVLPEAKVPRDEEFKFRERAKGLVDKWHQILNANKPNGSESGAAGNGATSAPPEKAAEPEKEEEDAQGVTEGTAAMDLNGKAGDGVSAEAAPSNEHEEAGDTSVLADVTMSEA